VIKIKARAGGRAEILIHEAIGENWYGDGLTSKRFVQDIQALGDVSEILVRINSPGGAVFDGVAIYNALKAHGARIDVRVEGLAASIASVIAMAGDTIRMGPGSTLMIHNPATVVFGEAEDMRAAAAMLDKVRDAMLEIYVNRTGMDEDELKALLDAETWMTSAEAIAYGFADEADDEDETDEAEARAKAAAAERWSGLVASFRQTTPKSKFPLQVAAAAFQSARADAPSEVQTMDKTEKGASANTPDVEAIARKAAEAALATEDARRQAVRDVFAGRFAQDHSALLASCLDDRQCSAEQASKKLLAKLAEANKDVFPIAGNGAIQPGADESDKRVEAATDWLLARAGEKAGEKRKVDGSNPYKGFSLTDMAEDSARRAGVNVRGLTRSQIVAAAFGHTTSDFPNLLENTLNKLLLVAYTGAPTTWRRIARTGDLADFRAHPRYRIGTFSDLATVNESGRYEQGTVADAQRESITAVRKGRMLVVTREMIVNDDLQAFSDIARNLGSVAARTIDKDLYALFALNSGNGPTMGDGQPLFHSTHFNIDSTGAVPSVTRIDAMRVLMARQQDPSGNDFLDIRPAIALSGMELGSALRVLNESQYDPDATNRLQRPNVVRGLVSDVVDTPRLTGTAYYLLASPAEEPVFEVGFVGGVQEPTVEQMEEFDSDSLKWKVVLEYGVAAIGWRGIVRNAGA